ncbi:MAG: mechanosensitive ion channel family protein [Microcoleaceae cyanobacterium]
MTLRSIWSDFLSLFQETDSLAMSLGIKFGFLLLFIILSIIFGRWTARIISFVIRQIAPQQSEQINQRFIYPFRSGFQIVGTLVLLSFCLGFLKEYEEVYQLLRFFLSLAIIVSLAWLVSRICQQIILSYGITIIQKLGWNADDFVLILETATNIVIGFISVIIFANLHDINLLALVAGLGIGGLAVAFAAQKVLEQLIGTIVVYLDRPYLPGEYIRVNFNIQQPDVYGRVESIGLRSTKIRIAARNTLLIVPNSIMATKDIENVTRGKKVMVLLYLDFDRLLDDQEKALVEKVVEESTSTLFGIDPGSTKVAVIKPKDQPGNRARVTFFILGSSESSNQLRKRLLELSNEEISQQLIEHSLHFEMKEPTIYVDSPIPI